MKLNTTCFTLVAVLAGLLTSATGAAADTGKLNVVTTSADYADIAKRIGGDRVEVRHIARGDEDPHFVRPKPSFAPLIARADLLIATGLDLELWLPPLIDKAGNRKVREGQVGYVAVHYGIAKLEVPKSLDRSEGDVHVLGNPHLHTSPAVIKQVARNIAVGLIKVDPDNEADYKQRLAAFEREIDERLFGRELVDILGSAVLTKLALRGNLIPFLEKKRYRGKPLVDRLGGWMKKALPLRGQKVVTYHKNWAYFTTLFGLEVVAEVEPKPGIPPSPKDVARLISKMKNHKVEVIFAANYFDSSKVRRICKKIGATPAIVPLSVGGSARAGNYFELVDLWIDELLRTVR